MNSFHSHSFHAIGTRITVVASLPQSLAPAVAITERYLDELSAAASRFRADSELSRLNRAAGDRDVTAVLSPLLARVLHAALRTAHLTGGLVDPTIGAALQAAGYDRDLTEVQTRRAQPVGRPAPAPGWSRVHLAARPLTLPKGTVLDLGASAKALAADEIAAECARRLSGGFVVNLGGDLALGGTVPAGGWRLGVELADGSTCQVVTSRGQALATSSTRLRTWLDDAGQTIHHIIDPATGSPAEPVWAQVTCCAASTLEANAASTAAVVLGDRAVGWLERAQVPALLIDRDGQTTRVAGWPEKDC